GNIERDIFLAAAFAQCADGNVADTDGDGLLDCWETQGVDFDGDGTVDLVLYDVDGDGVVSPAERADPNRRDIYLEIDFMQLHRPMNLAVNDVIDAFAVAPLTNPDGTDGVRLHVQVDEEAIATHNDNLAFVPATAPAPAGVPDFDAVKGASFGTGIERADPAAANILAAKRLAVRYGLFAHALLGLRRTSGMAELPGNDFVVSLGGWTATAMPTHTAGTRDQQAGTLLHELGHNLNLGHGGVDHVNCKPNYLSVMSYTRQFDTTVPGRPLDYSRGTALPISLDETDQLQEPAGIGGPAVQRTVYGPPAATPPRVAAPAVAVNLATAMQAPRWVVLTPANQPIDWNRNGVFT
ncbi:MAG: hypothetical protein ACREIV_15680, partial [Planctomycetaceae bacterium]